MLEEALLHPATRSPRGHGFGLVVGDVDGGHAEIRWITAISVRIWTRNWRSGWTAARP
jgi:hypothetical protein